MNIEKVFLSVIDFLHNSYCINNVKYFEYLCIPNTDFHRYLSTELQFDYVWLQLWFYWYLINKIYFCDLVIMIYIIIRQLQYYKCVHVLFQIL